MSTWPAASPGTAFNRWWSVEGLGYKDTPQGPAVGRAISELIMDGRYRSIDLTRLGYRRIVEGDKMLERYCV